MSVMAGILSVLALLLAVATIAGMIAPALFRSRKTGQIPGRLSILVWGCIAVLVAMVLAGSFVTPPPEAAGNGANETAPESAPR